MTRTLCAAPLLFHSRAFPLHFKSYREDFPIIYRNPRLTRKSISPRRGTPPRTSKAKFDNSRQSKKRWKMGIIISKGAANIKSMQNINWNSITSNELTALTRHPVCCCAYLHLSCAQPWKEPRGRPPAPRKGAGATRLAGRCIGRCIGTEIGTPIGENVRPSRSCLLRNIDARSAMICAG